MSIPDHELDSPDPTPDFTCLLCGDVKPFDDISHDAAAAEMGYEHPVCWKCWGEVQESPENFKIDQQAQKIQRVFGSLSQSLPPANLGGEVQESPGDFQDEETS